MDQNIETILDIVVWLLLTRRVVLVRYTSSLLLWRHKSTTCFHYPCPTEHSGGLVIAIVGTFHFKMRCDGLGNIHCNDTFEKIHRSRIVNFIDVTAMNFRKYCDEAQTFFYKKINQNNIFQHSRRRFLKNSEEWHNCAQDITSNKKTSHIKQLSLFAFFSE